MSADTAIDRIVLRQGRDADGTRHLAIARLADGRVVIEGQDIGAGVERAFGRGLREYEWRWTIAAPDVPTAVKGLGGTDDANVLGLLASLFELTGSDPGVGIKEAGIPVHFWSRVGD